MHAWLGDTIIDNSSERDIRTPLKEGEGGCFILPVRSVSWNEVALMGLKKNRKLDLRKS